MTSVGPETTEYVIETGSWSVSPGVREHYGDELLDKINKPGVPRMPPGQPNSHIPKPSVGRIVHAYTEGNHNPLAAIVTYVFKNPEDGMVSLHVFGPMEGDGHQSGVPFSKEPKFGHWSWPPRA